MNDMHVDVSLCDREAIHIPGAIQPHGLLLVVDPSTMRISHAAGDPKAWLSDTEWHGATPEHLLGAQAAAAVAKAIETGDPQLLDRIELAGRQVACRAHRSGNFGIIELEPTHDPEPAFNPLVMIEAAAVAFERSIEPKELFAAAALEFRRLTGFDRVMIYRFLDDDAGVVVGETTAPEARSFLNHHFPAADIPKQARALYVRNLVRVIPDVSYVAAALTPAWLHPEPLDMSDAALRSVSPVHLQYLRNMAVGASASFSILKDGALWGLVACHNATPRLVPPPARIACLAMAGVLARQVKAREETEAYRERVRLRAFEDDIVSLLSREGSLQTAISNHINELMKMLGADGVAVRRGSELVTGGRCLPPADLMKLADWSVDRAAETVFATDQLGDHVDLPAEHLVAPAGMMAITLSAREPWSVLWFRAEQREVVKWAGNPHKNEAGPGGTLTPRASFDAWQETVRGSARRWTLHEIEAASRLRTALFTVWQNRRINDLNRELMKALDEKDLLLKQKEFLIGEVNHRVQNSLQLVSSFLSLQARASSDPAFATTVEEARRRIAAVSLVHRRLYRSDQIETIDAGRYVDELLNDLIGSLGADWKPHLTKDLQPVMVPTDRVIPLGLVLTELVINANKYAYGGAAGPLRVTLTHDRGNFRLIVADAGIGRSGEGVGFGSRMMDALIGQLGGTIVFEAANPGTRAVLSAPIQAARAPASVR